MYELKHEYSGRKISPWGGVKYLYRTYTGSAIQGFVQPLALPHPNSDRGYAASELIEGFITSVVLGLKRL